MKKFLAFLLAAVMVFSLVACSAPADTGTKDDTKAVEEDTKEAEEAEPAGEAEPAEEGEAAEKPYAGAKLEFTTRIQEGAGLEELRDLIAAFNEETGAEITLTEYADADYESALKTRMASNEMPDIFETHGWSRLRYGEFLEPVNDEPWYQYENDVARGILEGDGGVGYALMMTSSCLANIWNYTVCMEHGVDPWEIETMDQFYEAIQKLVDDGIVPFVNHNSAGDLTHTAGLYTSYDDALEPLGEEQLNGTYKFDPTFKPQLEFWADMIEMGAMWEDRSTMDTDAQNERMASGKSVLYYSNGTGYAETCHDLNPEYEYVCTPYPAIKEGAKRYVAGGEGYTIGVYNESPNKEVGMAFLSYAAENGQTLVNKMGGLPALTNLTPDETSYATQLANECMEKYPEAVYVNMWDREYMPSGMWGTFGEMTPSLYADWSEENQLHILEELQRNYDEKWAAAHGQ